MSSKGERLTKGAVALCAAGGVYHALLLFGPVRSLATRNAVTPSVRGRVLCAVSAGFFCWWIRGRLLYGMRADVERFVERSVRCASSEYGARKFDMNNPVWLMIQRFRNSILPGGRNGVVGAGTVRFRRDGTRRNHVATHLLRAFQVGRCQTGVGHGTRRTCALGGGVRLCWAVILRFVRPESYPELYVFRICWAETLMSLCGDFCMG